MPSGRTPCQLGSAPRSLLMLCLEVTFRCNEPRVSQRNRLELARCSATYRQHRLPVPGLAERSRGARSAAPSPAPFSCLFFCGFFNYFLQRRALSETAQPPRSPERGGEVGEKIPETLASTVPAAAAGWRAPASEREEHGGRRLLTGPTGGKSTEAEACVPTNFCHWGQESPACDLLSSPGACSLPALGRPWL